MPCQTCRRDDRVAGTWGARWRRHVRHGPAEVPSCRPRGRCGSTRRRRGSRGTRRAARRSQAARRTQDQAPPQVQGGEAQRRVRPEERHQPARTPGLAPVTVALVLEGLPGDEISHEHAAADVARDGERVVRPPVGVRVLAPHVVQDPRRERRLREGLVDRVPVKPAEESGQPCATLLTPWNVDVLRGVVEVPEVGQARVGDPDELDGSTRFATVVRGREAVQPAIRSQASAVAASSGK